MTQTAGSFGARMGSVGYHRTSEVWSQLFRFEMVLYDVFRASSRRETPRARNFVHRGFRASNRCSSSFICPSLRDCHICTRRAVARSSLPQNPTQKSHERDTFTVVSPPKRHMVVPSLLGTYVYMYAHSPSHDLPTQGWQVTVCQMTA